MYSQNEIREFCLKHSIRVVDTNKRAHKYHKVNLNYFKDPADFDMLQAHIDLVRDTEPLYTVEIALSELEKLAEFEKQTYDSMKEHSSLYAYQREQEEREKFFRERYPALKKAHDHYKLLLKLANSGEL